jgi:hypothetical protein
VHVAADGADVARGITRVYVPRPSVADAMIHIAHAVTGVDAAADVGTVIADAPACGRVAATEVPGCA